MNNLLICLGSFSDYINAYSLLINLNNPKIMLINQIDILKNNLLDSCIKTSNEIQVFNTKKNYDEYFDSIDFVIIFDNEYYVINFLEKIKKFKKKIIKIGNNTGFYKKYFNNYVNYYFVENNDEKKELETNTKSRIFVIENLKLDLIDKLNNRYENSVLVYLKNMDDINELKKIEDNHKYIKFIYYDFLDDFYNLNNYLDLIEQIKKSRYIISDNSEINQECLYLNKKNIIFNNATINKNLLDIRENYILKKENNYARSENWKQIPSIIQNNFIKVYCERWVTEDILVNKTNNYRFFAEFEKSYNINTGEYLIGWTSRNLFYNCFIEYDYSKLDVNNDIIIIFASNIITPSNNENNYRLYNKFLKFRKKFIIGCGTQINNIFGDRSILDSFDPGDETIQLFKSIKNTVAIRGNISEYILKRFNIKCKVLGCPTLLSLVKNFTKITKINKISKDIKKVLISPTIYTNKDNTENILEYSLSNNLDIILCTEKTLYKMKINKDTNFDNYKDISDYPLHLKYKEIIKKIIENENINILFPKNFDEYFEILKKYDFLISTRIHCCIINISLGLPTLCIAHDSRTFELCQTMNIPFIVEFNKTCKLETLIDCYNNQVEKYNNNINTYLNNYTKYFKDNKIPIKSF